MKSTRTLRFPIQRLFLLTLVSFVAVAALLSIAASANKSSRAAKARAEQAANTKSAINPSVQSDKQGPLAPSAAVIVATLTDNITAATKVAPGGTINYTAVITNNGAASPADDATNLNYSGPLDANTTLVAGSVHASPIAFNDTYNWVGNTQLDTAARSLPSVTANDVAVNAPAGTDTFTVTAIAGGATTLGGTVTLASPSGAFTYTPPVNRPNLADGASVQDTFTYTITNSVDPTLTSTGTVRITLTGRVFYLLQGAAGDGRSNTPSGNPATMSGNADKATDIFYIFSSASALSGPFTVDAGQQLLGSGVNLVVTIPTLGSVTLFNAAAPTPAITNAGTCVALAGAPGNNTLSGFNIGNCTGGFGIAGANVGTLTVSTLSINGNGGALDLTGVGTPTVNVVLGGTTSTGGTRNVNLVGLNGTVNLAGGALSGTTAGATNHAFAVSGGNAAVTFTGTITKANQGNVINIASRTGGTISLSGAINGNGSSGINASSNSGGTIDITNGSKALNTAANAAVTLSSNTGATINFSNGGLDIDTTSGAGFTATGGGTVNVTTGGTANTIDTDTGTGVNIATPTNIGGGGVTFQRVTVDNGASNSATNGIILNGTTGTFLVSGDGSQTGGFFDRDGSGGTLNRTTGHAVLLTNAQNVTLRQMNITNTAAGGGCPANCTADAVRSTTGANIVLSAVLLQNLGGNGWNAANITGTSAVNHNSLIQTWNTATTSGVTVANTTTNFSGTFTVDRTVFSTSATGADGFLFDVDTAAGGGTVTVTNSEFTLIDQDAVQINHDGSGILNATVQNNNFHDADATGGDGNNTLVLVLTSGDRLNFNISNNAFTNLSRLSANSGVLQVMAAGGSAGSAAGATLNGTINNNTLTNPGFVSQRRGIMFAAEASAGDHGSHAVAITNNSVQNFFLQGIYCSLASVAGFDVLNTNLTITGNQVGNVSPVGQNGGDSGSAMEYETLITADGTGGQLSANVLYQNNTAVSNNSSGIGDTLDINNTSGVTTGAGNSSNLQLTVLGNTLTQSNAGGQVFEARNVLTSTATMCIDLNSGNTSPNNAIGGTGGFRLDNDAGSYSVEGMGASTPSAFLGPRNQSNGASPATITALGTIGSSAGCTNPTPPTAPEPVGDKAASNQTDLIKSSLTANATAAPQTDPAKVQETAKPVVQLSSKDGMASVLAKVTPKATAAEVARIYRDERRISHHAVRNNSRTFSQEPNAPTAGEIITLNPIATFPAAGKSITIKYSATVNTPPLARQVSTQGTVTANAGAISVVTDDPEPGGGSDLTVTLVDTLMTWNGVTSSDWNTATNWTPPAGGTQYVPGASNPAINDVVIPGGAIPNQPTISAGDIGIYSMNIANGRTLTIQSVPLRTLTIGGLPGGDLTLDGIISGGNLNLGTGAHFINNAGGTGSLSSTNLATVLSGSSVTLNNNLQAGALTVNAGGIMTIATRTLSLNGSGAALADPAAGLTTTGSTVIFNGTAAQQAAGITYNNLTINNTIGAHVTGVTLTGNATVNGALTLTSSDLATGAFTLTMPAAATSGPASGATDVVGNVRRTGFVSGGVALSFGNPFNTIRINSGTVPTDINVLLAKNAPATYAAAALRSYTITPSGGSGITATVRLHYRQVDLINPLAPGGSVSETPTGDFNFRRFSGGGWKAVVPTSRNVGVPEDNWLENNAVTTFSEWTFANFTPTAADGIITGRIVDANGRGVEGAVMRLNGTQNRKFITDANGFYRFDNVETNGFYTVTPSRANYEFSPNIRSISVLAQTTEAIFTANETGQTANPLDTPEYYVRQHYIDFLGREPDEAGFNFWSDQILECGGDVGCTERRRENVSAAYFLSIEFQKTGGMVDGFYRASYGARPQFGEFMPDTRAVGLGVRVGEADWEAKLQANKEAFAEAFVNRAAFRARYDGMDASTFVETLISNTGVNFTSGERTEWIGGLTLGNLTRADVVRGIAENQRYIDAKFNDSFVMMEYFGYLRRDADPSGFAFWLNKLNEFNGNFEQAEMVKAFIISGEYRDRFPR